MGVPAFYRWLSEKYPKIVEDVLEKRVHLVSPDSTVRIPFDSTLPNPSSLECSNLYIDMNGIIHPCSHPENGEQPSCEEEMYENVCQYVDRLFRAVRPRKLLYLAIDGVAPRAKMNQQRARRFRSAQEARELAVVEDDIRKQMEDEEEVDIPQKDSKPWDSNVITPGTPFMMKLSEYVRFYVRKRIAEDKAWKNLKVIFSDASVPGEGEHKIMAHIRHQRAQPNYDPNLVHVLHGLDADLIMLALATHEAHFYILREEVSFGRRSLEEAERRRKANGFYDAQKLLDEEVGSAAMDLPENSGKLLQRISIPILREYLANEFQSLSNVPFASGASFERLIDDIVFLCFFVGNDFLPHLPSLDIRDGALDFLFNVYKRLLPSMGDYITNHGGEVNLRNVDVVLAEVGAIEDHVFTLKYQNEQQQKKRKEQMMNNKKDERNLRKRGLDPNDPRARDHKPTPQFRGKAARIIEKQDNVVAPPVASKSSRSVPRVAARAPKKGERARFDTLNSKRIGYGRPKPDRIKLDRIKPDRVKSKSNIKASTKKVGGKKTKQELLREIEEAKEKAQALRKRIKKTQDEDDLLLLSLKTSSKSVPKVEPSQGKIMGESELRDVLMSIGVEPVKTVKSEAASAPAPASNDKEVDTDEEMFGIGSDDEDEKVVKKEVKERTEEEKAAAQAKAKELFKKKVQEAEQKKLDEYAKNVVDKVRLHEKGWKDRYYKDKCKADDVENHGGRDHLFRSYVMGLCWVMKYYYDGCPSWKWYFPFHYAPFASDLRNIERYQKDCMSFQPNRPFRPVEQLMSVLPSDSKKAVPKAARWLMSDEESPIIDFYPTDVPCDPNGKAMPWLWVVLLPFIDEDRLLAALKPTMSSWSNSELLCNTRGLDDGYIFIHISNPLVPAIQKILHSEDGRTKRVIGEVAPGASPGFSGSIRPPLSNEILPTDPSDDAATIAPPPSAQKIARASIDGLFVHSIEPNKALCVAFTEPPKSLHRSIMLEGAVPPPQVLNENDKRICRPRLNRGGGSIANLGTTRFGEQPKHNNPNHGPGGRIDTNSYERGLRQGRQGVWNNTLEPTAKRQRGDNRFDGGSQSRQQYRPDFRSGSNSSKATFNVGRQDHNRQRQGSRKPSGGHQQKAPVTGGNHIRWQAPPQVQSNTPTPPTYQQQQTYYPQAGSYQQPQMAHQHLQQPYNLQAQQHHGYVSHQQIPQPLPQQQQQGHTFQSHNWSTQQQQQQTGYSFNGLGQQNQSQQQQEQQKKPSVNPNLINSLRSKLASTLRQHRQGGGRG